MFASFKLGFWYQSDSLQLLETEKATNVSKDVFPEPLGPISRKDGNVVVAGELKKRRWRRIGIRTNKSTVKAIIRGDCVRKLEYQLDAMIKDERQKFNAMSFADTEPQPWHMLGYVALRLESLLPSLTVSAFLPARGC